MNLQDRELELNFREITCKRSVQGANFAQGVQDFDFSVSGKHAFIPSLSYFVIQATLTTNVRTLPINTGAGPAPGGVPLAPAIPRIPYLSDDLTYADHFGACLYNNCFFRAGNSDVSTIMQYVPQASVLKTRLDKSGAWCKYLGRDLHQDDPDFTRRLNKVSLDGTFHEDGLKVASSFNQRALLQTSGAPALLLNVGTLAAYVATTGVLTFSGASPVNALVSAIAPGDIIELINSGGPSYKVVTVLTLTTILVQPTNTANVDQAADQVAGCFAPADPRCGFNTTQIVFQPPLGIFSTVNPISGGDFKITLNPNPNYATAGIQSSYVLTSGVDYNLTINNVLFYACQIRADVSPSGIIPISMLEMQVVNKSLSGMANGGTQNIDFTVPPSTLALTVFVQSSKAGTNTSIIPTQFYSATNQLNNNGSANLVNNIQYIQVTYGSVTKTQTLYSSAYRPLSTGLINDSGINYNIQRWLQSIQYSGKITSEGGAESHQNFLDRGNYWHFDFSRDKNDTSSYVNVQLAFNSDQAVDPTDQLFVVAHYSRQAEVQYENGYIVQVVSVNR
jgi:hypothetical protein